MVQSVRAGNGRVRLCSQLLLATSVLALASAAAVHAADVEITTDTPSVDLDAEAGSTAHIATGVTVGFGNPAIVATLQPWTITNDGTVTGGNTVQLDQGGTFTNAAGSTVSGTLTALTFGYNPPGAPPPTGGPGTLHNYGTITGGAEAVTFWYGGTANNYLGGVIRTTTGLNAVSIGQGTYRTLYNEGLIEATRTTGFSTGVLIQGGPASFTNTSTGVIFGDYNGVYASATGVFTTFQNAGSIRSNRGPAVEAAGGGVFVNTGTIQNASATLATMLVGNAASITNTGTIQAGSASGTAIRFTGNAVHNLTLGTGSNIVGFVRGVAGGTAVDNLILQGTGTEIFNDYVDFETLTMQGTAWDFTGIGTFGTSATVGTGELNVLGTLVSPTVTVNAGARLAGTGIVSGSSAVQINGTVAAGNSGIGTLSINGPVTFGAGSTLEVEVTEAGATDLVAITGTADILGGTVNVIAANGLYNPFVDYTIVTTTGGRTGTFTGATSNYAFLAATLSYDAQNVYLRLARNGLDFTSVGQTFNQISTAGGVDTLSGGNPVYDAVVVLDEPTARYAFDQLSGEVHASVASGLMDESRFLREAILGRGQATGSASGQAVHGISVPGGLAPTIWAQGYGAGDSMDTDGNAADFNSRSGGIFLGAESVLDNGLLLGGVIGVSRLTFDVDERASSGDSDNLHVGLYGAGTWGGFGLKAGASYTLHKIDTNRHVQFQGFDERLKAGYDGHTAQIYADAGYAFTLGSATVEPFLRAAYVNVGTESFSETGGAAALSSPGVNFDTALTTIGVRGSTQIGAVTLHGMVGWQHAFGGMTPQIDMAFAGQGAFPIRGVPLARDMAAIDAGLEFATSTASKVALTYSGRFGDGVDSQAVKAGFEVKF